MCSRSCLSSTCKVVVLRLSAMTLSAVDDDAAAVDLLVLAVVAVVVVVVVVSL